MKKTNIFYWIFTGLFAAMMVFSSIPSILNTADSVKVMHDQLGYPNYITPFLGVAKLLGVIAILVPGFPRIKEWAYAGFFFDLIGATYSNMSIGGPGWIFMFLPVGLAIGSYVFYHKRRKLQQANASSSRTAGYAGGNAALR